MRPRRDYQVKLVNVIKLSVQRTSNNASSIDVEVRGVHLALVECTARNLTSIGFVKRLNDNGTASASSPTSVYLFFNETF